MSTRGMRPNPQVGEKVEFLSNKCSKHGPCWGTVIFRDKNTVCIHHNKDIEWFNIRNFFVEQLGMHMSGTVQWTIV